MLQLTQHLEYMSFWYRSLAKYNAQGLQPLKRGHSSLEQNSAEMNMGFRSGNDKSSGRDQIYKAKAIPLQEAVGGEEV
jgi:hypothetical protein